MTLPAVQRMDIDTAALATQALEMGEAGVSALERILALAERERDYQARCAYDEALRLVQAEIPRIQTDAHNAQTRSRYATLAAVDKHLRPVYTSHGFRIAFSTEPCDEPGWTTHVATVTHSAGHVEHVRAAFPVDDKGPKGNAVKTPLHGVGSSLSYAQRRLTMMAFGAVSTDEDDDGQAATAAPVELVTREQADEIRQHAMGLFADPGQLLKVYSVDTFAAIPAMAYADAMQRIERRRKWLAEHPDKAEELAARIGERERREA